MAVFQRKLATLPLVTYQEGETVLSAASTTGRLLILKEGAGAVVKEGVEIARVMEPSAVFGELSVLLALSSRCASTVVHVKERAAQRNWENGREDRRTAGRHRSGLNLAL